MSKTNTKVKSKQRKPISVDIKLDNPRLMQRFVALQDAMSKSDKFMAFGVMNRATMARIALCEWMDTKERQLGMHSTQIEEDDDEA